jgi:hypothetical protein
MYIKFIFSNILTQELSISVVNVFEDPKCEYCMSFELIIKFFIINQHHVLSREQCFKNRFETTAAKITSLTSVFIISTNLTLVNLTWILYLLTPRFHLMPFAQT